MRAAFYFVTCLFYFIYSFCHKAKILFPPNQLHFFSRETFHQTLRSTLLASNSHHSPSKKTPFKDGGASTSTSGLLLNSFASDSANAGVSHIFDARFGADVAADLVTRAVEARQAALDRRDSLKAVGPAQPASPTLFSFLWALLDPPGAPASSEEDECERTAANLDFAAARLAAVFVTGVDVDALKAAASRDSADGGRHNRTTTGVNAFVTEDEEPMTPERRWDIINRNARWEILKI